MVVSGVLTVSGARRGRRFTLDFGISSWGQELNTAVGQSGGGCPLEGVRTPRVRRRSIRGVGAPEQGADLLEGPKPPSETKVDG